MNNPFRDNGGKLPAGLTPIINTTGKPIMIKPKKTWLDHMINAFKEPFNQKPKRKHAITVRKLSGWYGNFWKFSCTPCGLSINYPTWETAYHQATHHAHNHH